jgi:hypothetical protein
VIEVAAIPGSVVLVELMIGLGTALAAASRSMAIASAFCS